MIKIIKKILNDDDGGFLKNCKSNILLSLKFNMKQRYDK